MLKPQNPTRGNQNDLPGPDGGPTPEQRAEFVLMRLEQFIRNGRTIAEGMNFKQWRDMARVEIANAIAAASQDRQDGQMLTRRILFTAASAFVTIGFWGTMLAFGKASYLTIAIIFGIVGAWLFAVIGEWPFRHFIKRRQARNRARILYRVENLTKRIRKMEIELKDEEKRLKKMLEAKAILEAGKNPAQKAREEAIADASALANAVKDKFGI